MFIEDTLAYMEPPHWYYPVRQSLGAVRLRQGNLDGAQRAFQESLARVRNNAWALAGLAETYKRKGDVAALKKRYSGDLILYGIGELANYLAHQNLVDEVRFWIHPYIWGDGVRPFHAGELPLRLRLISATTYTSGMVRLAYQPTAG